MKRKLALLIIIVLMLGSTNVTAKTEENTRQETYLDNGDIVVDGSNVRIVPRWLYTWHILQDLQISQRTGETICAAIIHGYEDQVSSISAHMYLEREISSGTYRVEKSWHKSVNDFHLDIDGKVFLTIRGKYRGHVQYYVYNKEGRCEIIDMYTDIRTY